MTDAELLETGALCEALLSSSQFATVVAQYEQSIAADIIATAPPDFKKREELYSSLWGTRGLRAFMELQALAAAQIKDPSLQNNITTPSTYYVTYDDEGFERDTEQ